MQMLFPKKSLTQESPSWKAIIQLNLIRHVLTILKILEEEEASTRPLLSTTVPILPSTVLGPSHTASAQPAVHLSSHDLTASTSGTSSSTQTDLHRILRLRLAPLVALESNLTKQISSAPDTPEEPMVYSYTPRVNPFRYKSHSSDPPSFGPRFEEEVGRVVDSFKDYIASLWRDEVVQGLLQAQNVKLKPEGDFFLDDLDRVCALDYEPNSCKYRLLIVLSRCALFP